MIGQGGSASLSKGRIPLANFFFNSRSHIFFSFGAIQITQLALPLLAYPWLGRKLGPEAFGLLMYMALIPSIVNIVMDWGLPLAAARSAAKNKSPQHLSVLVGAALSARILLLFPIFLGGALLMPWLPHALEWPLAYFLAIGAGVARGINPLWYYQGTGWQMKKVAGWDVASSILVILLMFFLVREAQDWQRYLLLLCVCKGGSWLILDCRLWLAHKARFDVKAALRLLGEANLIFAAQIFNIVSRSGSQLVLGYFLPVSGMGIIVAINKMAYALSCLAKPLFQTLYPQICSLGFKRKCMLRKILFLSIAITCLCMGAACAVIWLLAPWVLEIALGPEFEAAAPVLRIIILSAPLMACNLAIGEQLLVAWGWEKARAAILGLSAFLALLLAALLPFFWGLFGAAWQPVLTEFLTLAMCFWLFWRRRRFFQD